MYDVLQLSILISCYDVHFVVFCGLPGTRVSYIPWRKENNSDFEAHTVNVQAQFFLGYSWTKHRSWRAFFTWLILTKMDQVQLILTKARRNNIASSRKSQISARIASFPILPTYFLFALGSSAKVLFRRLSFFLLVLTRHETRLGSCVDDEPALYDISPDASSLRVGHGWTKSERMQTG